MRITITLYVAFLLLALAFLATGFGWKGVLDFLGEDDKTTALAYIGSGMAGVLVALNSVAAHRRAEAMQEAARAQADATEAQAKANKQTEDGRRQERFKNAIEHLGHESAAVRLGGRYELYNLARDTAELRRTVLDFFCNYIRQATSEVNYQEKHSTKPSSEIQELLTLTFVREPDVFGELRVDLEGSWLQGADLRKARLWNVNLRGAHLCHAYLCDAHLERADLSGADLRAASLRKASLREACLFQARMHGCNLSEAKLQGASLWCAQLPAACLWEAQAQGANLDGAEMLGADLRYAGMQGTYLPRLKLQGAMLDCVTFRGAEGSIPWSRFAERINRLIGERTNLSGVDLYGGITQEQVENLIKELIGHCEESKGALYDRLMAHTQSRDDSREPPTNTHVCTASYQREVASRWIGEHQEAMSKVPSLLNVSGDAEE